MGGGGLHPVVTAHSYGLAHSDLTASGCAFKRSYNLLLLLYRLPGQKLDSIGLMFKPILRSNKPQIDSLCTLEQPLPAVIYLETGCHSVHVHTLGHLFFVMS